MKNETVYCGKILLVERVIMPGGHVREVVRKRHAVAFLLYDPAREAVAFVRQPRAPAISEENPEGLVMEAPAGHIESGNIRAEVVREAKEELGITMREDQVRLLNGGAGLYTSPGWTSEMLILAYAELEPGQCDETQEWFGLKEEGERTQRIWVPVADLVFMEFEDAKTFALVQGFLAERGQKRFEILLNELFACQVDKRELAEELNALRRVDSGA